MKNEVNKKPFLTQQDCGKYGVTLAAKNIRIDLKNHYPKRKFSVTAEKYSMGDSVNVTCDKEILTEVSELLDKFQEGTFCGMTDCYNSEMDDFKRKFGDTKFVMCRSWNN